MPDPELKAYVTGIHHEYDEMWAELELVIAESPEAAARLAYPGFSDERIAEVLEGEDDYTVERCEAGDALVGDKGPRIVHDMASLRAIGFHFEDEHQCEACEEWSEDVCSECCLCSECAAEEPDHECDLCGRGAARSESNPNV